MKSFITKFHEVVQGNYNCPVLNNFRQDPLTYHQFYDEILSIQNSWKAAGLVKGDKVAIFAPNSSNWVKTFFAAITGGYIAVELYHLYTPQDVMELVCHSDSKILYTDQHGFSQMDIKKMPNLIAVVDINSMNIIATRNNFTISFNRNCDKDNLQYNIDLDDICTIIYTSGSTGVPKGVMLSVRNISANFDAISATYPYRERENYLSTLPFAHSFGLMFDVILPICSGMHTHILCSVPTPTSLIIAFNEVRPHLFFTVPIVLQKLILNLIGGEYNSEDGQKKLANYFDNPDFCQLLRIKILSGMGGSIEVFATGGASIPFEIESLLLNKLSLPFVTIYGMTECSPIISLDVPGKYKMRSCGKYIDNIQLKVDSQDSSAIPGEILVKGDGVFVGYYKNSDADSKAFTPDGWFHTGDLATIDDEKNIFISGRCKNMFLYANGENIYQEDIEAILNKMPLVLESLIVCRDERLVALIVPKRDENNNISNSINEIMTSNIQKLNSRLPHYSHVAEYELFKEPFAKTSKGNIRRYMYK